MPFNLDLFEHKLTQAFEQIKKDQSEALSIQISVNFTAGMSAAAKHKSIKSEDPQEEDGLSEEDKAEIAAMTALYLGYISEFNNKAQDQVLSKVQEIIDEGGDQDEIKQYLDDVFSGKESIVIDNTGQERKEIYVNKNLKLLEVTRTVENPFYSSVDSYVALVGATVAHTAYEAGRKAQYQNQGYDQWVFTGPADEKARPGHVALLGQVFTWGAKQSGYAERCLREPRCRHRAEVYWNDPKIDKSSEYWKQLKDEAGLYWDEEKGKWVLK